LDALERNFNIVGSNTDRLGKMIKTIGFNYGSWYDQRGNGSTYYEISGYSCLEKRIKLVNPKNFVHTTKYFLWKRDNFYITDTSLSTRLKALNLNTDLLTFRNG
jgi:hypothetical protein